jgi:hypothetical protein
MQKHLVHWSKRAIAPVLLVPLLLGSCTTEPGAPSPSATPPVSPSASEVPSPSSFASEVEVFYVVTHPKGLDLVGETRELDHSGDLLESTLAGLIGGRLAPVDPDYANLWSEVALNSLQRDNDVLRIDLGGPLTNVGAEAESLAIDQVVWTATGIDPSIRAVMFTINGATPETLGGHVDTQGEFVRGLPESTLTPLQILSPTEGEAVGGPFQASGVACVFEGNITWQLLQNGTVIDQGTTMSAGACPDRTPWSVDLGPQAAGEYTLVIIEYSMEDGEVSATDTKTFTVSGT